LFTLRFVSRLRCTLFLVRLLVTTLFVYVGWFCGLHVVVTGSPHTLLCSGFLVGSTFVPFTFNDSWFCYCWFPRLFLVLGPFSSGSLFVDYLLFTTVRCLIWFVVAFTLVRLRFLLIVATRSLFIPFLFVTWLRCHRYVRLFPLLVYCWVTSLRFVVGCYVRLFDLICCCCCIVLFVVFLVGFILLFHWLRCATLFTVVFTTLFHLLLLGWRLLRCFVDLRWCLLHLFCICSRSSCCCF